jgi:uncharacterized membrane protein
MFADYDINSFIHEDLIENEEILWSGQPNDSIFCRNDWAMIPLSLFWSVFTFAWEIIAIISGIYSAMLIPFIMAIFGIPFVIMSLYILIGRFFYKSYLKKNIYYYVTNKRAIVAINKEYKKFECEYLDSLNVINKQIDIAGSGNIIFGNSPLMIAIFLNTGLDMFAKGQGYNTLPMAFCDLDDADVVIKLINEVRRGNYENTDK